MYTAQPVLPVDNTGHLFLMFGRASDNKKLICLLNLQVYRYVNAFFILLVFISRFCSATCIFHIYILQICHAIATATKLAYQALLVKIFSIFLTISPFVSVIHCKYMFTLIDVKYFFLLMPIKYQIMIFNNNRIVWQLLFVLL